MPAAAGRYGSCLLRQLLAGSGGKFSENKMRLPWVARLFWATSAQPRRAAPHSNASGLTMDCPGSSMRAAMAPTAAEAARAYLRLFPNVYLRFHRRDAKHSEMSGASRGVMLHLAQSGPLTVGECAKHLQRAQSVVSEIVDQLERHGLLARVRDESDRRRTLVWLTDQGRARLVADQEVLSSESLERALARMKPEQRAMLLEATRALIQAAELDFTQDQKPKNRKRQS